MGDWADQPDSVWLTEPRTPATYGNFRICWLWTINRVLWLCAFILVVTLQSKSGMLSFYAFLSLRTVNISFIYPKLWIWNRSSFPLQKPMCISKVTFFPQDASPKEEGYVLPLWPTPPHSCLLKMSLNICWKCMHDSNHNRNVVLSGMNDKVQILRILE